MTEIPPRITHFYFVSDQEAGVPFAFSDVREEDGALFDPSPGPYGGFRISGPVDGIGDEVEQGVDAMLTLLVLFTDGEGIFNIGLRDVLLRVDVSAVDNCLTIQDARALG